MKNTGQKYRSFPAIEKDSADEGKSVSKYEESVISIGNDLDLKLNDIFSDSTDHSGRPADTAGVAPRTDRDATPLVGDRRVFKDLFQIKSFQIDRTRTPLELPVVKGKNLSFGNYVAQGNSDHLTQRRYNSSNNFSASASSYLETLSESLHLPVKKPKEQPAVLPDRYDLDTPLTEYLDFVPEIVYSNLGSRYVQERVTSGIVDRREALAFFARIKKYIPEFSKNIYGNHIVQAFMALDITEIQEDIYSTLVDELYEITTDRYGCRVMQRAFDVYPPEKLRVILEQITRRFVDISKSEFGNHVILKAVSMKWVSATSNIHTILSIVLENLKDLSQDPFGCRVVQKVITKYPNYNLVNKISENVLDSIQEYIEHEYANYVLQCVLKLGGEPAMNIGVQRIRASISRLVTLKISSNVLETWIKSGNPKGQEIIFEEALNTEEKVIKMSNGKYSNYIVQAFLVHGSPEQKKFIQKVLTKNIKTLKKGMFSAHVIRKMQQTIQQETSSSNEKESKSGQKGKFKKRVTWRYGSKKKKNKNTSAATTSTAATITSTANGGNVYTGMGSTSGTGYRQYPNEGQYYGYNNAYGGYSSGNGNNWNFGGRR